MIALKSVFHLQILLLFADVVFGEYFYNWQRQSTQNPVYKPMRNHRTQQRMLYDYYPTYYQMSPEDYYYYYYYYNYKPENIFSGYPSTSYDYFAPYYQDVPVVPNTATTVDNKYRYYDLYNDPERLIRDYQIQQREMQQPIGHEVKYESDNDNEDDDDDDADADGDGTVLDETNAAFLKNLMMQQMYEDSVLERRRYTPSPNYYERDYNGNERPPMGGGEDEEVQELKELPKKQRQRKNRPRKQRRPTEASSPAKRSWFRKNNDEDAPTTHDDVVVYTDRKPVVKPTDGPKREARGQKEEVLLRPATPVRRPFSDSVLEMMNQEQERKRSPSVYDTIRHMLDMEKKHDEKPPENQKDNLKPSMRKRIVSSEDSLTRQLSILKKSK